METSWYLIFGAVGVFIAFVAVYLVIMFLWPEWVGITGKVALEAERSHREGAEASDQDLTTQWQAKPNAPGDKLKK